MKHEYSHGCYFWETAANECPKNEPAHVRISHRIMLSLAATSAPNQYSIEGIIKAELQEDSNK